MPPIKQLTLLKKHSSKMRLAAESWNSRYKTLVATILSARTRDEKTIPTAKKLFQKFPSVKQLANARLSEIQKIIRPINFYKNKSKHILACAKTLFEKHNSRIPMNFEELISLPGVGRKTANVFLSEYGKPNIGIDTHVAYISRKLGWTKSKSQKQIEQDLKNLFPKKLWKTINPILVRFGKTHTSRKKKDKILGEIKNAKNN